MAADCLLTLSASDQWVKCNGTHTQGNAVPPPPIYDSKRSPTSDCYNAEDIWHTTIVRGPNLNVAFPPPLIRHFKHCVWERMWLNINGK